MQTSNACVANEVTCTLQHDNTLMKDFNARPSLFYKGHLWQRLWTSMPIYEFNYQLYQHEQLYVYG